MPEESNSTMQSSNLPNIFKLADYAIPEDRFTAAWGYLLNQEPQLARNVAAALLVGRDGLTCTVTGVTDHPWYDVESKPDFRIDCEEFDLVVEHKLDAALMETQLERYLNLPTSRQTLVAFIAPSSRLIPDAVFSHEQYLKPLVGQHFRWSDLFQVVRAHESHLAQQFADYMESLGMAPYELKGPEDIFDETAKPEQFSTALKTAAEAVFGRVPGGVIKRDPGRRGVQIQRSLPAVALFYVIAERQPAPNSVVRGPTLSIQVFESEGDATIQMESMTHRTASGLTLHRHVLPANLPNDDNKRCRVSYFVALTDVLAATRDETTERMSEILFTVRDDWL